MSKEPAMLYKTYARKETHPARIGAIARLYGLDAPSASDCRVLEFACGDGGNLIPLAVQYPQSYFVGIDINGALIERGCARVAELGLTNIVFEAVDVTAYSPEASSYDYVICHGLYSWVPPKVREDILQLGMTALREHGVFYVSYNTLPGWRQRGAVRDILQAGAHLGEALSESSPNRAALRFADIIRNSALGVSPYIHEALDKLTESDPAYISQEFLGSHNDPMLFTDFMRDAESHGLQYLSESRVVMMSTDDLNAEVRELLERCEDNRIQQEQILDIVRNRTFRETLLCHSFMPLQKGLRTEVFKNLILIPKYVSSDKEREGDRCWFKERFSGREIELPYGECTRVLGAMSSAFSQGGAYVALEELSCNLLGCSSNEALSILVTLWKSGFVDVATELLGSPSQSLTLSQLMLLQIRDNEKVTSPLHESYELLQEERQLLQSLVRDASRLKYGEEAIDCSNDGQSRIHMRNLSCMGFV